MASGEGMLRQSRDDLIEECAKIAEAVARESYGFSNAVRACLSIAANIRSLKKSKEMS